MTSKSSAHNLFVYGTLRPRYKALPKWMRDCNPPAILETEGKRRWVGSGTISKFELYDIGHYPGVVHRDCGVVHGDVFSVELDEMPLLDSYEMISDAYKAPYEYKRIEVDVNLKEPAESVKAWVYLYNWPIRADAVLVSSGDYVEYISSRCRGNVSEGKRDEDQHHFVQDFANRRTAGVSKGDRSAQG